MKRKPPTKSMHTNAKASLVFKFILKYREDYQMKV